MKCALIMAGGCGTRLYPLSTLECPKQFVKMFENKTLIQLTYERLSKFFEKENIFIVLPEKYKHFIEELLPEVNNENIIIEPSQRSTAPCVLYSCLYISKVKPNSTLFVFPSDHYIKDEDKFIETLDNMNKYILKNNSLILMGIKPNMPSERYGYIKFKRNKSNIVNITKFKEKPNKFKANLYYLTKNYYWSSDTYAFNINYILNLYKELLPNDYKVLTNKNIIKKEVYNKCTHTSVAYAIFEKLNNIAMIKYNYHWDDVGVFESLIKYTNNINVINIYNDKIINENNTQIKISDKMQN